MLVSFCCYSSWGSGCGDGGNGGDSDVGADPCGCSGGKSGNGE